MKIIYPNHQTLYTEDPEGTKTGFPLSNLLDDHILKKWKATVAAEPPEGASVIVEMKVGGSLTGDVNFDSIALFGLEADQVDVEIFKIVESEMVSLGPAVSKTLNPTDDFGPKQITQVWFDLAEQTGEFFFKITLWNHSENTKDLSMGRASIGKAVSFKNPTWGAKADLVNHTLVKALKNGSSFKRKKPISRKVNCTLELPTSQTGLAEYQTLISLYERSHSEDFACLWAEGLTDASGASLNDDHLIWGSFGTDFQPVRGKYSLSTIQFSLTEGV